MSLPKGPEKPVKHRKTVDPVVTALLKRHLLYYGVGRVRKALDLYADTILRVLLGTPISEASYEAIYNAVLLWPAPPDGAGWEIGDYDPVSGEQLRHHEWHLVQERERRGKALLNKDTLNK